MSHSCPRCGYKGDLSSFKRHLNRAHLCSATIADVSLDDLKAKFCKQKEIKFECQNCKKGFGSRTGYVSHQTKCGVITTNTNTLLMQLVQAITNLTEIIKANSIAFPSASVQTAPAAAPPSAPKKINEFGAENVSYLFKKHDILRDVFNSKWNGLLKMIDLVWFDEQHPEHHNIRVLNNAYCEFYIAKNWKKESIEELAESLLFHIGRILQESLIEESYITKPALTKYMKEVGLVLDWDLDHDGFECKDDIDDKYKEQAFEKICAHVVKHLQSKKH